MNSNQAVAVSIDLVQDLKRRLIRLYLSRHPLLRRIAPAGVNPHLDVVQPFDLAVERVGGLLVIEGNTSARCGISTSFDSSAVR